ncbi:hypothetical protein P692DRAFT_20865539 [Suillus brevipes Sb2]|nr:hypothetical protein P692DRAFT_20865539 [Suillus brevipes Sb2]
MAKASRISSNFGSDAEKQSLYIPAKEEKIHSQSSTFCRYYPAGSCRRGSACRFGHLQPPSVPQEYARPNEHVVHTRMCRYNAAGYCQRGSACHFVPQGILLSEYVYPNAHEVYTRTPHKGWDQDEKFGMECEMLDELIACRVGLLPVSAPAASASYQDVRSDKSETNWLLLRVYVSKRSDRSDDYHYLLDAMTGKKVHDKLPIEYDSRVKAEVDDQR